MSNYTTDMSHRVHQTLVELRKRQGVTQEDMAERLRCSVDTVSRFEREQAGADCLSRCLAYQEALGVDSGFIRMENVSAADPELVLATESACECALDDLGGGEMPVSLARQSYAHVFLPDGTSAMTYHTAFPCLGDDLLYRFRVGCVMAYGKDGCNDTAGYVEGYAAIVYGATDVTGGPAIACYLDDESEELCAEGIAMLDYLEAHPFDGNENDLPDWVGMRTVLFISAVYTEPECRKKGVLSAMHDALQRKYGSNCIVFTNLEPFEYGDGDDGLTYTCEGTAWDDGFARNRAIAEHYGYTPFADPEAEDDTLKLYAVKDIAYLDLAACANETSERPKENS